MLKKESLRSSEINIQANKLVPLARGKPILNLDQENNSEIAQYQANRNLETLLFNKASLRTCSVDNKVKLEVIEATIATSKAHLVAASLTRARSRCYKSSRKD